MTNADRKAFAQSLAVVAETFGETMSRERVEAYFRALFDLSWPAVDGALQASIRRLKWFPKPAELRDLARGRDPRQVDAWYRRGWDPDAPGFLPGYDGHGSPAGGTDVVRPTRRIGGPSTPERIGEIVKRITGDRE